MRALLPILLLLVLATVETKARTIIVPAGGDFQAALHAVNCRDEIHLAVAKFVGNFRLPNKNCTTATQITIRPADLSGLPENVRVTPDKDSLMPRILAPGNGFPAIETDAGAGWFRFIGLFISVDYGSDPNRKYGSSFLISLSNGSDSNPSYGKWLGHDFTFDRCHIAGKFGDSRFAFAVAGERLTVKNSIITNFANPTGGDSAGFWFSNAGGHVIENNEVQAGMWMIFTGGGDSDSPNRAVVAAATVSSVTLKSIEGVRPVVGDLLSLYVRQRNVEDNWQPNTSYALGTLQYHHSDWTRQNRPGSPLLFYVTRAGTSGKTEPSWSLFDEYHNQTKTDGSVVWKLFQGDHQVGKVTSIAGDTFQIVPEGPSGTFLPAVVNSVARWNGYSPSFTARRNWFHRPAHWGQFGVPDKGMLQFKNATNVLIEGNVFSSDVGWPGLLSLTPGNQGYSAPWSVTRNITFRNNFAEHLTGLFNTALVDTKATSDWSGGFVVENNLFANIGGKILDDRTPDQYSGGFWLGSAAQDMSFIRNTIINSGRLIFAHGLPNPRWTFKDNIVGMSGHYNFCEVGEPWSRCFPESTFAGNVVVGSRAEDKRLWPAGTFFPVSWQAIGFRNYGGRSVDDWLLRTDSPYQGKGVDIARLKAALAGNLPLPTPMPTPTPRTSPTPTPSCPLAGFDEAYYLQKYADVRAAVESGAFSSGCEHYQRHGQGEGRCTNAASCARPNPTPTSERDLTTTQQHNNQQHNLYYQTQAISVAPAMAAALRFLLFRWSVKASSVQARNRER